MEMEFQQMLLRVQQSLSVDEVQDLVFLCSDQLFLKDLSTVSSARELFSLLDTADLLSPEDPSLLVELLKITKRHSLIRMLRLDAYMQTADTASCRISPYRQLLFEVSESITKEDLKNIKFLLGKTLSRRTLAQDKTLLQLFLELEKEDLMDENNLDILQRIIGNIYPSLEKRIIQYKTERLGGMFIAQETNIPSVSSTPTQASSLLPSLSVSVMAEQVDRLSMTEGAEGQDLSGDQSQQLEFNSMTDKESPNLFVSENPQIEQYEMKGDRRGICVIINNYDFSATTVDNREGTQVDEEKLRAVFQWLGFDVLIERDCSQKQILNVLKDLGSRDHTEADCVACCVLSHGSVNGVMGVDGHIVTFRELIQPLLCCTLYQKPKLFFIQACRGSSEQKVVYLHTDSSDDVTYCDALVPRDSIPEGADYLLAMSSVPYFVSYREKETGTWFIQSLCKNLQQLVPQGVDLLSILTQVNNDVSKKTDKCGIKKQMPQPEFTLTKRVVFPMPRTSRPLL